MIECCICEKKIEEVRSNNAVPFKEGKCCDLCNMEYVIPKRMGMSVLDFEITKEKEEEEDGSND
jgi:hypothetical protein